MRQPWIQDRKKAALWGAVFFAIGVLLIYDAYERRGGRAPWVLRLLSPL